MDRAAPWRGRFSVSKKPRRVSPPEGGERKAATARFPPRGIAAAACAANMPPACLLTLRRRKNTLRGASVESSATWGPRRSPAKRVRWGEEAQRSERRLPLCGGRRDTELVPTTRRAQRNSFGGKGVSLFRQSPAGTRCLWGRVPACGRDRSEIRNYSALSTASTNRQVRSTESIPSRSRVEWISTMSGPKLTASRPGILSISRPHSSPA